MDAYAIVETGGKQYMVKAGETLKIERIPGEAGAKVSLGPVLARSDGTAFTLGRPAIEGAAVDAEVVALIRGPKVVAFKKKRRKGYHRKVGHRQDLTVVKITRIA